MCSNISLIFVLQEKDREERRMFTNTSAILALKDLDRIVYSIFNDIKEEIIIYYKTSEGANILLNTDEDLARAFSVMQGPVFTFFLVKHINSTGNSPQVHPGIVCDVCQGSVVGLRFKCLYCANYDLCNECESTGVHDHHIMLRIGSTNHTMPSILKFIHGMVNTRPEGRNGRQNDLVLDWMEENMSKESREQMNEACKEAWKLGESIQSAALTAVTSAAKATSAAIETTKGGNATALQKGAENLISAMLASISSFGVQVTDMAKSEKKDASEAQEDFKHEQ